MLNQGSTKKFNISTNRLVFCIGLGLIFLLILTRNLLKINLPVVSILLVVVLIFAFSSKTEIIALMICCIPLATAFQYKYAILVGLVIYLLKFGRETKITWAIIPLLLMMLWELLHAIGHPFSILEFLRGFTEFILCTVLLLSNIRDVNYKFIVRALASCSIFVMAVMLFKLLTQSGFDFVAIFEGTYRFGVSDEDVSNYALNFNSNQLGLICNLSIIGLLQLVLQKENNKLDYLWIGVLALFGVMTMSRTFVLSFLIIMILFLFSRKEPVTKKIKKLIIIVFSVLAMYLLAKWLMPMVVQRFYERFTVDDITNHRGELIGFYNNHIFSSAKYSLFGIGIQNMGDKLLSIYPNTFSFVPHNGLQEVVVVWGMIGLILFVLFVLAIVFAAKKKNSLSLGALIPLIIILIVVQAGQLITNGTALLGFAFSFVSLVCVKKR